MKQRFASEVGIGCLLAAAALFGCADTGEIVDTKGAGFKNPYAWIGEAHNEGLGAVLNSLESHRNEIRDAEELFAIADLGIKQYFRDKYGVLPDQSMLQRGYDFALSQSRFDRLGKNATGISPADSLIHSNLYSDAELSFLTRLRNLRCTALASRAFDDSIDAISLNAFNQLGERGAEKILVQLSVARSSYHYWTAHGSRWFALLSQLGDKAFRKQAVALGDSVFDGYVDNVVETDYVSAGAALIPCAFASIGWAPCVLGAAVGGSTVYAIWHFPYWPW